MIDVNLSFLRYARNCSSSITVNERYIGPTDVLQWVNFDAEMKTSWKNLVIALGQEMVPNLPLYFVSVDCESGVLVNFTNNIKERINVVFRDLDVCIKSGSGKSTIPDLVATKTIPRQSIPIELKTEYCPTRYCFLSQQFERIHSRLRGQTRDPSCLGLVGNRSHQGHEVDPSSRCRRCRYLML